MRRRPAYLHNFFSRDDIHWASYIAGIFTLLESESGIEFEHGAHILIDSQVPIGKGVSSSAAIEVATMHALCAAFGITLGPLELARLCQRVENLIVGAACGVMDQVASNCGRENSLLSLLCQPAEIIGYIPIPQEIEFWGIDSGVRHAVSGSDYTSVRIGAFMGYRIIADLAGLKTQKIDSGLVTIDDPLWHGHLANITPDEYQREFASRLPKTINGADFLAKYVGTTDTVTRIDPHKTYAVNAPTEHGIYENFRVNEFESLLQKLSSERDLEGLGHLMLASHESYRACGLTEHGTERLVELVSAGRDQGLYGARITGGGSGGTVVVLAKAGGREVIEKLSAKYQSETGRQPYIFHGSSCGAADFGQLRLEWVAE
jgi:L-arabinokinase